MAKLQAKRMPWDQYFMAQAVLSSLRSTCPRATVGAAIVRDRRVIASGYNGSVSGDDHCIDVGCYLVDGHCLRTIHAEMNAILQCAKFGAATEGAAIYVTHFPCLQCTKMLIQAGIKTINYLKDYHDDEYAQNLIKKSGVALNQIQLNATYFAQFEHSSLFNLN
uniref:ComE operon protein 2 n=1 Tax=Loigolactobacillus rennini TaxID=238013 RepID=A0A1K2I6A0_9LACO|nr:dCMP deaminase; Late competence protein ComEB [Loigolactobacillus rennini]